MIKAIGQEVTFKSNEDKKNSSNVMAGAVGGTVLGAAGGALVKGKMTTQQLIDEVTSNDKFQSSLGELKPEEKTAYEEVSKVVKGKEDAVKAEKSFIHDVFGKDGDKVKAEISLDQYVAGHKAKNGNLGTVAELKEATKDEVVNSLTDKAKAAKDEKGMTELKDNLKKANDEWTANTGDSAKKTVKEAAEKALEDAEKGNEAKAKLSVIKEQKAFLTEVEAMATEKDGKKIITLAKAEEKIESRVSARIAKVVEDNAKKLAEKLPKKFSTKNTIFGAIGGLVLGAIIGKIISPKKAPEAEAPKA